MSSVDIIETTKYFNMIADDLAVIDKNNYTVEERKILDEGLVVHFIDSIGNIENLIEEIEEEGVYEVKVILKMVDGRYAVVNN